jgi:hypothetical protein
VQMNRLLKEVKRQYRGVNFSTRLYFEPNLSKNSKSRS